MSFAEAVERALRERGAIPRGRHLRARCPAPEHADVRPSCDVDLSRGWICRSCGAGGGLVALAKLLGVAAPERRATVPPAFIPAPPPGVDPVAWAEAWMRL